MAKATIAMLTGRGETPCSIPVQTTASQQWEGIFMPCNCCSEVDVITHEDVIDNLHEKINRSLYGSDERTVTILRVVLTYEPVRAADSAEGMVFVPTWAVIYQDQKASEQGYDCFALFNAMDGTLIDASFR